MNEAKHYSKLKNLHAGETGILIANGPGLSNISIELLAKYPSFGCNRIHLLFDKTGFAPTYYVCMAFDHLEAPKQREALVPMLAKCKAAFVNRLWAHEFPLDEVYGILSTKWYGANQEQMREFSYEPLHAVGISASMIYGALQIAMYMGFQKIGIVGMDHEYAEGPQKHFYTDAEAPLWEIAPGPHRTREEWATDTEQSFGLAYHAYRMIGREIINLSEPTKCKVFPTQDWRTWL